MTDHHRANDGPPDSRELLARLDVEWIAMRAQLKPGNRITIEPARIDEIVKRARREGFHVQQGEQIVQFPGRPAAAILYISPDAARAREMLDTEAPLLSAVGKELPVDKAIELHTRLGGLLGFPLCCVEEFCTRLRRGITRRLNGRDAHEDFVAAECAVQASQRLLARLNDLCANRRARIVTFYPCRYDCPTAAAYAAAVFATIEQVDARGAVALRTALLDEVSIAVDGARGAAAALDTEVLTINFTEF